MGFDTNGLRKLSANLATSTGRVGARAALVVRKTAHDIEADAKAFCPVDTGNLRNSISTDVTGDGRFGTISAEVGPTANYGLYVEAGTSRMAPQPYMGPAVDKREPAFVAAIASIGGSVL